MEGVRRRRRQQGEGLSSKQVQLCDCYLVCRPGLLVCLVECVLAMVHDLEGSALFCVVFFVADCLSAVLVLSG